MKTKTWKQYALGILLTQSIGALSGWLSRDGMQIFSASISQPPLSPPAFLFPIVWGVLYALMGIGARKNLSVPAVNRAKHGFERLYHTADFQFLLESDFLNAASISFRFFLAANTFVLSFMDDSVVSQGRSAFCETSNPISALAFLCRIPEPRCLVSESVTILRKSLFL